MKMPAHNNGYKFKPDTWIYKDEIPMNGGDLGGAITGTTGFDTLSTDYAIYRPDSLANPKGSCTPSSYDKIERGDDLRNGMGKLAQVVWSQQ